MEGSLASLKAIELNSRPSQVPTLSQRKQQRLGLLPALVVMSKQILQKKNKLLLLIYSDVNTHIEEKTIKEPSLLLPEKADQPLWLWLERGRQSRSVQQ